MSNTIRTFNSLPTSLQGLVIELAITRARQDQHSNLINIVEEAVVAAGAALKVGVMPEVSTDPAKPGEDQTAYQQAEPQYEDPETFDPKQDDALDAFALLASIFRKPEQHCGLDDCQACNEMFGKQEAEPETNKMRFVQVFHQDGEFGPVDIYRSRTNRKVFALMNKGRTALIESDNITQMPYQAAVEIVRVHGKADRSIVG